MLQSSRFGSDVGLPPSEINVVERQTWRMNKSQSRACQVERNERACASCELAGRLRAVAALRSPQLIVCSEKGPSCAGGGPRATHS